LQIKLSSRVQRVKPSPTLAVTSLAAQLKAEGRDIISLGAGEPDFNTPRHICDAAIQAINEGFTGYTPVDGTPGLKQAVIDKFQRDNGLEYTADQILVSSGGKQSFFNLAQALLDPGDEVVIPAPYWVSYPDMVKLAGGEPVILRAEQKQDFKITPEQLRSAITDRTRLFVINSPSNPTGSAYTREELAAIGEVLKENPRIVVATDDMYEHILWTEEGFVNIVNACPELYDRTVVLNGVSKAYAMTGWRIGYAGGPETLIQAMKKVQSQSTSNPASISQVAAEAALNGDQGCVTDMVKEFKKRHDFVVDALNELPGVSCNPSQGTFYAFPNVEAAIAATPGVKDDVEFANHMLQEVGVAMVPGSAFGLDGHMRLSYATSMEQLEEAMARLKKALA